MLKYFCNVCGDELDESNPNRASDNLQKTYTAPNGAEVIVKIAVAAGPDQAFRSGELCDDCFVRAMTYDIDDAELTRKRTKELPGG